MTIVAMMMAFFAVVAIAGLMAKTLGEDTEVVLSVTDAADTELALWSSQQSIV